MKHLSQSSEGSATNRGQQFCRLTEPMSATVPERWVGPGWGRLSSGTRPAVRVCGGTASQGCDMEPQMTPKVWFRVPGHTLSGVEGGCGWLR